MEPKTLVVNEEQAKRLGLTPRETQVSVHIAHGLTDPEIGEALYRTPRTAKAHALSAMAKTDTHTRAQLIAVLFVNGVLTGRTAVGVLTMALCVSWLAPASPDVENTQRGARRSRLVRRSSRGASGGLDNIDHQLNMLSQLIPNASELYSSYDVTAGKNA